MTIINQKKHISSEVDEKTFIGAQLSNGVLTFLRKDFYNNETASSISLDLKSIKLRVKKTTTEHLEELTNATSDSLKQERETNLFLTPLSGTGEEGVWREHVWVEGENGEAGRFEVIGSTRLDLENYLLKTKVVNNLTTSTFDSNDPTALSAKQGNALKTLVDGKAPIDHASANSTYGLSTVDKYGHAKTYNENPSDVSLTASSKGTQTASFAMGDHVHKHPSATALTGKPTSSYSNTKFGDTITISQVKSNNTGHVDSLTDRTIKIPNTLANGTTAGLSTNDYTTDEKNAVANIETTFDDKILEVLTEMADRLETDEDNQ